MAVLQIGGGRVTDALSAAVASSGIEELADGGRDFVDMCLQREVAGIEESDHRVRNIAFERFGAGRQEERIVLAPDRQERRPMLTEVVLERRIERTLLL